MNKEALIAARIKVTNAHKALRAARMKILDAVETAERAAVELHQAEVVLRVLQDVDSTPRGRA